MSKTIHAVNKSKITDVSIMLCFNEIILGTGQLYHDTFPTAWKVFNLAKNSMPARRTIDFKYSAVICEYQDKNIVVAGAETPITTSQEAKAWRDGNNFAHIDKAVEKQGGAITITNKETGFVDLALFDNQGACMMVQQNVVGHSSAVFIPKQVVWAYVVNNYKENQVVRAEVVANVSTSYDLASIKTDITVTYSDEGGVASLTFVEGTPSD
jgi:hypothetical protein